MGHSLFAIGIIVFLLLFSYCMAIAICGATTFIGQWRVYHWAKKYLENNIADGWAIVKIDWFTLRRYGNTYNIYVHLWRPEKCSFPRDWKYATNGTLYFDKQGFLIKDDTVTKDWKKWKKASTTKN